jgi:hypothetical protein
MNIPIRVPQRLVNMWIAFGDWANVWVWKRGKLEVLRIDILLVILGMSTCGFYWALYGWRGATNGGITFVALVALALFMRR